jgi:lipoprotein NlpI
MAMKGRPPSCCGAAGAKSTLPICLSRRPGNYDFSRSVAVWQEMLIGYFLGKVSQQRLTADLLDTSRNFETSAFGRSSESRQGFLTEWYFYDALLQSVTGDRSSRAYRSRSRLEKSVDQNQFSFYEYAFAKSLLDRVERGEDLTRPPNSEQARQTRSPPSKF